MLKQVFLACILFATINCWVTNTVNFEPFKTYPAPVQCSKAEKVQGCNECEEEDGKFVCKDPSEGYYVDPNQNLTVVCPRQCKSCFYDETTGGAQCDSCFNANIQLDDNCQKCNSGFSLDQQGQNIYGICISIAQNSQISCAKDFMWDQTPNLNRKCVSQKGKCADSYLINSISGQCDKCKEGFTQQVTDINNFYIQCLEEIVSIQRPIAEQTKDFCQTYDALKPTQCIKAINGYYIDNNIIVACPQQCGTCEIENNVVSCLTCRDVKGYNDTMESNCQCDDLYTADRQTPATSYLCISPVAENNKVYKCLEGNTWSNQYSQSSERTCVSVSKGVCYQEKGKLLSYWYETPQDDRTCTLASLQQCYYNYAQKNADKSNFYPQALTTDCNQCIDGFQIQNNAGIQTCVQKTLSNIISFSLIALFSIFCLLI